jgi:hypothetical protein
VCLAAVFFSFYQVALPRLLLLRRRLDRLGRRGASGHHCAALGRPAG